MDLLRRKSEQAEANTPRRMSLLLNRTDMYVLLKDQQEKFSLTQSACVAQYVLSRLSNRVIC